MGIAPAPWATLPTMWALDDLTLTTRMPDTKDFVAALTTSEDRGAAFWTTLAFTVPADRYRIATLIVERGRNAPNDAVFEDVADALVAAGVGWQRWEAIWVWTQTLGSWKIVDGEHLGRGVDIMELPPGRATAVVFAWWRQKLGNHQDEWKTWVRQMQKEPRRVVRRNATQPMDAGDVAQLQGLIGQARGRAAVPASTITMPDQIT